MEKPRIIIMEEDFSYAAPLQAKFIYEFLDTIELEVITEAEIAKKFFDELQKADVLIVSKEWYVSDMNRHDIKHIFIMSEEQQDEMEVEERCHVIYKYTNIKGIFLEIVGKANLKIPKKNETAESKVIVVTSAEGGSGKTTVAIGLAGALSDMYKKVLYLDASKIQTANPLLEEPPLVNQMIYNKLTHKSASVYSEIRSEIKKKQFDFFPLMRAATLAFGIDDTIFCDIAQGEKQSGEYDYIILDMESTFDESKTRAIHMADQVIMVTEATRKGICSTNAFVANVSNSSSDKYLYICNKYDVKNQKKSENMASMSYKTDEYIPVFSDYETMTPKDLKEQEGMRKIAFLLI